MSEYIKRHYPERERIIKEKTLISELEQKPFSILSDVDEKKKKKKEKKQSIPNEI